MCIRDSISGYIVAGNDDGNVGTHKLIMYVTDLQSVVDVYKRQVQDDGQHGKGAQAVDVRKVGSVGGISGLMEGR